MRFLLLTVLKGRLVEVVIGFTFRDQAVEGRVAVLVKFLF